MDDKIYELPIGAVVHLVRGMVEGLMDRVKKIEDKMGDFFVVLSDHISDLVHRMGNE